MQHHRSTVAMCEYCAAGMAVRGAYFMHADSDNDAKFARYVRQIVWKWIALKFIED